MGIGIDFDNTIVCYDRVFHAEAVARGLVDAATPVSKDAVRNRLRADGLDAVWTALQGEVYGARMDRARPFPGVKAFFRRCRLAGIPVSIVSHKTRHPFVGPRYDLHAAANHWLVREGFFDADGAGMAPEAVFFETTLDAKLARIGALGCTHFIDDLPELLFAPDFPRDVVPVLFRPADAGALPDAGMDVIRSWDEAQPERWIVEGVAR